MSDRIPYLAVTDPDEWIYTTAGRIACEGCGEWIYPRRRPAGGRPVELPPECPVCKAAQ